MTTATTSTPVSNAATANFRAWGLEFSTQLAAVGLTQTSDTGQINWTTVALPGAGNTAAGFEIWRFNDTLQATSPIFIKIEYGAGAVVAQPWILITVGQGSNGSGTLTGTLMARVAVSNQGISNTATNAPSFWMYNSTQGCLGAAWKFGVNSSGIASTIPMGGFIIERSCDTNGNATGDAVMLITPNLNTTATNTVGNIAQIYSYLTSALLTPTIPTATLCATSTFWPLNPASSAVGSNNQVMPRFIYTPNIQLSAASGIALASEFGMATTFSAALIGTTVKTYIALGQFFGIAAVSAQSGVQALAGYMLWQ